MKQTNKKTLNSKVRKDAIKNGFRSGEESKVAGHLTCIGVKFDYECEKLKYRVKSHFKRGAVCGACGSTEIIEDKEYNPDFTLKSTKIILEVKGIFSASDRRKMVAVVEQNPDREFVMVFQDANKKISPKSKYTYGTWCNKNKIEWTTVENLKKYLTERLNLKDKQRYYNPTVKSKINGNGKKS